jgi:hypothetical protein
MIDPQISDARLAELIVGYASDFMKDDVNWPEMTDAETVALLKAEQQRRAGQVPEGWIRCSERMPAQTDFTEYVVETLAGKRTMPCVAWLKPDGMIQIQEQQPLAFKCTHWMPLPEPPAP